jgi:hypothetical protein
LVVKVRVLLILVFCLFFLFFFLAHPKHSSWVRQWHEHKPFGVLFPTPKGRWINHRIAGSPVVKCRP